MKKKIIVGLLVISALSFSAMKSNQTNMNNNCQRGTHYSQVMAGLSETQQNELTEMIKNRRKTNYINSLNIRTVELKLEKLLSNDKINWQNVKKVNDQISGMKSEQRLDNMKFRKNIEDKFGITMGHKGMIGHMNNKMMNENSNHMDNKIMNEGDNHNEMMDESKDY